jgi:hypothetical protein
MPEEFKLKRIASAGIEGAVRRADHYRLLNQPIQARSICHDVLAVDPGNERALVTLLLATTDDFETGTASIREAKELANRLTDEYQRLYYSGIVAEREARALLARGHGAAFAYDGFREAMDWFDKAAEIRPEGNDDALLRWNACVRTIQERNLRPREPDAEPLLE